MSPATGETLPPSEPLRGLKVLVLEDETIILTMMANVLDDLGCGVVGPAATADEALALAQKAHVDVALLDINLGHGETGYPVADALAKKGVPFAFVTAYEPQGLKPLYAGRPVLQKPFFGDALENVLKALAKD